jgi:hypothetical protein
MDEQTTASQPPQEEGEATQEAPKADTSAIVEELNALGTKLSAALQKAWESEERKHAETEIRDALKTAGERLDGVSEELRSSEVTKDLKVQAGKVAEAVEESKITQEVRRGLLTGLRKLNEELGKIVEKGDKPGPAPASSTEPTETPSGDEAVG